LITDLVLVTEELMKNDTIDTETLKRQHARRKPRVHGEGVKKEVEMFMGKRMVDGIHRSVC